MHNSRLELNLAIALDPKTTDCNLSVAEAREIAEEVMRLRDVIAKTNSKLIQVEQRIDEVLAKHGKLHRNNSKDWNA